LQIVCIDCIISLLLELELFNAYTGTYLITYISKQQIRLNSTKSQCLHSRLPYSTSRWLRSGFNCTNCVQILFSQSWLKLSKSQLRLYWTMKLWLSICRVSAIGTCPWRRYYETLLLLINLYGHASMMRDAVVFHCKDNTIFSSILLKTSMPQASMVKIREALLVENDLVCKL
jgi:hypothetical protein